MTHAMKWLLKALNGVAAVLGLGEGMVAVGTVGEANAVGVGAIGVVLRGTLMSTFCPAWQ